jgi:transcriptional regulator NrdR family protein
MKSEQPKSMRNAPDDRGLTCLHCGGRRFRVIYTRPAIGGKVLRRRECRECRRRVTTWERAVGRD